MKFEAKNLSPVAFHALTCAEVSVSIQCFDWSKMAAEEFPVARIGKYAKPCEPAIHVLRSVVASGLLRRSPGIESQGRQIAFLPLYFHFFFPISYFFFFFW